MRVAISVMLVGIGSMLAGWVLPMLNSRLPFWLQIALLVFGLVLIVIGALLGITRQSKEGGISVKMGDGNRVGQIGDQVERRR